MKLRMKTSHVVKLVIQDIVWYGNIEDHPPSFDS